MRKLFLATFVLLFVIVIRLAAGPWQNHVDYNIKVSLNDKEHKLTGEQTITYFNYSPDTLEKIYLLLYPNAYKNMNTAFARQQKRLGVKKFLNSTEQERGSIDIKSFTHQNQIARLVMPLDSISTGYVDLKSPLLPGDSIHFETEWEVKIPEPFSRFCHEKQNYFITQWFPKIPVYDQQGWHAYPYLDMGEFYYEFGNYDVEISLPKNYAVGATGELINHENNSDFLDSLIAKGTEIMEMPADKYKNWLDSTSTPPSSSDLRTWHFQAKNVVDFAWVASKDYLLQQGYFRYSNQKDSILIQNFFLPKNREAWKNALEISRAALKSWGDLCGPYPYPKVISVDGSLMAGGGMEYPMLTIVNPVKVQFAMWNVVGHEIGHNWFYGALGFDERRQGWLDEGLNTYGEMRFMEKYLPDSVSMFSAMPLSSVFETLMDNINRTNLNHLVMAIAQHRKEIQAADLDGDQYSSMLSYNASLYIKPAMGFRLMEKYFGRDNFDKALNNFYNTWKFRHPQPHDLQNSLEEYFDADLSWFFDDYIKRTELPDYEIKSMQVEENEQGFRTTLEIANRGQTEQPFPLALYNDNKEIHQKWFHPIEKSNEITLQTPQKPDQAILDPDLYTLESNYYNNYSQNLPPLDLNFLINFPAPNKYLINYIPYFSYNYNEGLKLGGGLYHLSSSPPKNTYLTYGTYALKSEQLNATFLYRTNFIGERFKYNLSGNLSHDLLKNKVGGNLTINLRDDHNYKNDLSLAFNYLNVKNNNVLDNQFWDSGKFINARLSNDYTHIKENTTINNSIGLKYTYDRGKPAHYIRILGEISSNSKINDIVKVKNRAFFTSYIDRYDLPEQYRLYAGGNIDPEFKQVYVYDRSGSTRFSPFNNYFIPGGVNLKGYQNMSGADRWALGYNLYVESYRVFAFLDAGDVVSYDENFEIHLDAGLGVNLGLIKLYLPMFLSDPYDGYDRLSNWSALRERFMVQLDLSIFNAFFAG